MEAASTSTPRVYTSFTSFGFQAFLTAPSASPQFAGLGDDHGARLQVDATAGVVVVVVVVVDVEASVGTSFAPGTSGFWAVISGV